MDAVLPNRDLLPGRMIRVAEGVDVWADVSVGPFGDRAVLLLAGADSTALRFHDLAELLLAEGLTVVRLDHRDSGRSTWLGAEAAYDLDDLAADAAAVLAALGVPRVHVVGRSMGGMVAQLLALDHPDLVESLTLVHTTPGAGDDRLSPPDDGFVEAMTTRLFAGVPRGDDERVQWLVELDELLAGSRYPADDTSRRRAAEADLAWGWQPESGHGVAVYSSPSRLDRLGDIDVPTLVVHGTADPVYPPDHGRSLAARVPGATLMEVDDLGHEFGSAAVEELRPALVQHLMR